MKTLQIVAVALTLLLPAAALAGDADSTRAQAREDTLEALDSYKKVLENELRELDAWVETQAPPGGQSLSDERARAKKNLEEIADDAQRAWDSSRARMDGVIDDLKRRLRETRAQR